MPNSTVLRLYEHDLRSDPTLLALIDANIEPEQAINAHPPLAAAIKEMVRIISQEAPPEDFWTNLYSWLVGRGFMPLKSKAVSPQAHKQDILVRFATVMSYDAPRLSKQKAFSPEDEQQLADTLAFIFGNMFPAAISEALRRDLAKEQHPASPEHTAEWYNAVMEGWGFMDVPPDAAMFEKLKADFTPLPIFQEGQAKATILERIKARMQNAFAKKPEVTWAQVRIRVYERTTRNFLIYWLKTHGVQPKGLIGSSDLPNYFAAQPNPHDHDGSSIPKRVLYEMFRMCKTFEISTREDWQLVLPAGNSLDDLGARRRFMDKLRSPRPAFRFGSPPASPASPTSPSSPPVSPRPSPLVAPTPAPATPPSPASSPRSLKPQATLATSQQELVAAFTGPDQPSDLDVLLETGQVAAAILSDPRHRTAEQTQHIELCKNWLSNRYFLRSWLSGAGTHSLDWLRDKSTDSMKALYLYYSTCHDGWSQLHAFLEPQKLQQWAEEHGHLLTARDDPSAVAQRYCFSKASMRALAAKAEIAPQLLEQRNEVLVEAITWHYLPKGEEPKHLSTERLARLFDALKIGDPNQPRMSRNAMWDFVWRTLDEAPDEVFQTVAKARLIDGSFEQHSTRDLKAVVANINFARVRFFQRMAQNCTILRLSEAEKALHLTVSNELTPVQRGKSLMLQYSRMMEVYGGDSCRKFLSLEGGTSWDTVLKEYFRTKRFVK